MNWFDKIRKTLSSLFVNTVNESMDEVQLDEALASIVKAGGVVTKASFDEEIAKQNKTISELQEELKVAKEIQSNNSDFKAFESKLDSILEENKALEIQLEELKANTGKEINDVKTLLSKKELNGEDDGSIKIPIKTAKDSVKEVKGSFIDDMLGTKALTTPFGFGN